MRSLTTPLLVGFLNSEVSIALVIMVDFVEALGFVDVLKGKHFLKPREQFVKVNLLLKKPFV